MPLNKTNLIPEIKEAFKDVTLDGGIGLSEANAIDNYENEAFKAACRKQDEKDNWNTIPSSQLNEYNSSLSFFDAKGMRFHLPAFIIADINEEYKFGMTFVLTHLSDYSKNQFQLLSEKQRKAVRSFLEYLFEHSGYEFEKPDIKNAIETYWSK
jgi:hypothetical protein